MFSPYYYQPRPPFPPPPTDNSTGTQSKEAVIVVVYEILLPLISTIGIIGNLAVFAVLRRNDKKFSGFMYSYMRGLAITDTIYLLFCIQVSIVTSKEYFLTSNYKPCETKGLGVYVWNILSPCWNLWSGSSDLVIVFMTVDRFKVMRVIDRIHLQHQHRPFRSWRNYQVTIQVLLATAISLVFHIPFFFQFHVEKCQRATYESANNNCWAPNTTKFAESAVWDAFNYCYEALMKLVPSLIIIVLNLYMLMKLREVWAHKKQLKSSMSCHQHRTGRGSEPKDSTTVATISALLIRAPSVMGFDVSDKANVDTSKLGILKSKIARKKKLHQRLLPSKVFGKEVRMTVFLVFVVFCHVVLTLPGNITYFMWTVFPEDWDKVPGHLIYDSVADLLYCINYSINFYLYCIANKEVRAAVKDTCLSIASSIKSWSKSEDSGIGVGSSAT